jgi:Asp/Glu/hydantoin racemase
MLDNLANIRVARAGHPSRSVTASLLEEDPDQLRQLVRDEMAQSVAGPGLAQARLAHSEDEAGAVFFACTLWGGLLEPVKSDVPVAVLDPLITLVKFAEVLAWT